MASRTQKRSASLKSEDIGELLDELQGRIDRCKVLYEQYFLGIQRTPPSQLHIELERRVRELTQGHIRNTGMRYRFTTLSQKFASYNTYWKRTLREIESGTYVRDMARVGRDAVRNGKDIPEELLAKMPKRMRERIIKDRDQMLERSRVQQEREGELRESGKVRENRPGNVHQLDDADLLEDLDLDSIFSSMMSDAPARATTEPVKASGAASTSGPNTSGRAAAAPDTDVQNLFRGSFPDDTIEDSPGHGMPARAPASAPARTPPPPTPHARRPAPPAAAAPRVSAAKPPPGMSEADAQSLYMRYKKARELVGENTSGLSYDKLMNSLNKQAPQILKQHQARGVTFDVVVKGDRVVLKAKPQK